MHYTRNTAGRTSVYVYGGGLLVHHTIGHAVRETSTITHIDIVHQNPATAYVTEIAAMFEHTPDAITPFRVPDYIEREHDYLFTDDCVNQAEAMFRAQKHTELLSIPCEACEWRTGFWRVHTVYNPLSRVTLI